MTHRQETQCRSGVREARSRKVVFSGNGLFEKFWLLFWGIQGVILVDCLKGGETMNSNRFCQLLSMLYDKLQKARPGTFARDTLLLYDNAPPHRASNDFAKSFGFEVLPHPAYSPDLSPCDFYLFSAMKREMKGREFDSLKANFYRDGMMKLIRHHCPSIYLPYSAEKYMANV